MKQSNLIVALVASKVIILGFVGAGQAEPIHNTLWVGTEEPGNIFNITLSGTILRSATPGSLGAANGIAVDVTGNKLYIGSANALQALNLTTLAAESGVLTQTPPGILPEDMTFIPSTKLIMRPDYGLSLVNTIDAATNTVLGSFSTALTAISGPVGAAFDGSDLWISGFNNDRIEKFTTAGVDLGVGFSVPFTPGGLAFDPLDNTLFIGTSGEVFHYTLTGTQIGSGPIFSRPDGPTHFVDGLEFEGAVPEPASLTLGVFGVLGLVLPAWYRRRSPALVQSQT